MKVGVKGRIDVKDAVQLRGLSGNMVYTSVDGVLEKSMI